MKRAIALSGAFYGVVATGCYLGAYIYFSFAGWPSNLVREWVVTLQVVQAVALLFAFQPTFTPWPIFVRATRFSVVAVRLALALAAGVLVVTAVQVVRSPGAGDADWVTATKVARAFIALGLLSSVYLAAHWLLRPEAFLPNFVVRLSGGLPVVVSSWRRWLRRRKRSRGFRSEASRNRSDR